MDETTARIREMYEQFPYPTGRPANRVGNDVELALSAQAKRPASDAGSRRVLDAGCGRGVGLLGAATLQPRVRFLGVDLNRVALREATQAATDRGLANARFQEADLMTLEGIDAPDGGFDVIHSSGVVHHLSDPAAGLRMLRDRLAPHGVINLMMYARLGRRPLVQTAEAIALLLPRQAPLKDKVLPARAVAALANHHVLAGTEWEGTYEVDDVEFVDRLLNVNETDYDVPALWKLLEEAGLKFLRWIEPADWAPEEFIPEGQLRQWVAALPPFERYRFAELIRQPTKLELLVCRDDNGPRPEPTAAELEDTPLQLNPELVIRTGVRRTPAGRRTESLELVLRTRDPQPVGSGPHAQALMALKEKDEVFGGGEGLIALQQAGLETATAREVLLDLVRREFLYRPWA